MANASCLRLLHVVATVDPTHGGVAESIRQHGLALERLGHQVEVACGDVPSAPWLSGYPLTLHALGPRVGPWQWTPRLHAWLRRHVAGFDAVVVNGLWLHHVFVAHQVCKAAGKPLIVLPHGMLNRWSLIGQPWRRCKKSLMWRWVDGPACKDASALVFTSDGEAEEAAIAYSPPIGNSHVIPIGVDTPDNALGPRRPLDRDLPALLPELGRAPALLFLGRIHEKKSPDLLINAMAQLVATGAPLHLIMAGQGEVAYVRDLRALVERHGLSSRVHWLGWVSPGERWSLLQRCEALVLPSHQENFGVAVVESLAAGRPVLISDQINIHKDVLADGAGLVEPDTPPGVQRLLQRWSAMPEEARRAMGVAARACHARRYSPDVAAHLWIKLVNSLRASGARL